MKSLALSTLCTALVLTQTTFPMKRQLDSSDEYVYVYTPSINQFGTSYHAHKKPHLEMHFNASYKYYAPTIQQQLSTANSKPEEQSITEEELPEEVDTIPVQCTARQEDMSAAYLLAEMPYTIDNSIVTRSIIARHGNVLAKNIIPLMLLQDAVSQEIRASKTKLHPCTFAGCDKFSISKKALNRHFNVHTKPFICSCGKAFSRQLLVDNHTANGHIKKSSLRKK